MSLPELTQVLVVGAGPTGLTVALSLAGRGVQVVVVDAGATNHNGSRSTIVFPRSLEIFDAIGLLDPILEAAVKCEGITVRGTTNTLLAYDFSILKKYTKFPFPALISQEEVEKLALEKLQSSGIDLYRNKRVVAYDSHDNDQGISVLFEDGDRIRAKYIVGADGARSTIRSLSGIQFENPATSSLYDDPNSPVEYHIVFADVFLKEPLHPLLTKKGPCAHVDMFLLMIPLGHTGNKDSTASFWRIAIGFSANGPRPPKDLSKEYMQALLDERNPYDVPLVIQSLTTVSRYRVRAAVADTYFKKIHGSNILLAGDAAHVHAPFGGQGMNLGIGDAYSVANAIKEHIEAKQKADNDHTSDDAVLQRYAESRRKVGEEVIATTGQLTWFAYMNYGWKRIVRNSLIQIVGFLPFVKRMVVWRMSGLGHRNV